jgi:hypothetical protein
LPPKEKKDLNGEVYKVRIFYHSSRKKLSTRYTSGTHKLQASLGYISCLKTPKINK